MFQVIVYNLECTKRQTEINILLLFKKRDMTEQNEEEKKNKSPGLSYTRI